MIEKDTRNNNNKENRARKYKSTVESQKHGSDDIGNSYFTLPTNSAAFLYSTTKVSIGKS